MFYTTLLTSGKLQTHFADLEEQAQKLFDRLMKQKSKRAGIAKKLKAERPMLRVGRMNALREAVTETVNTEVIFVWEGESITFTSQQRKGGIFSTLCSPTVTN